jgi:hypothetical protein
MNLQTMTVLNLTKVIGLILLIHLFPTQGRANSLEAIAGDMQLANDAAPHGAPRASASEIMTGNTPPEGWHAMTATGQLYRDASDSVDRNTRIEFRDMEAYVLSKTTNTWSLLQGSVSVRGRTWNEANEGHSSAPKFRNSADGSVSVKLAHGRILNFFPKTSRGSLDSSDVAGIFTTVQARLIVDKANRPDDRAVAKYLIRVGGEYWKGLTTHPAGDGSNSVTIGTGRYKYVTTEWQNFNFTTLTPDQLAANPPPMLDSSSSSDPQTPAPKPTPKPLSNPTPVGAVITSTTTTGAKPDVVVTSLAYANGVFTAIVKNQGTGATPTSAYIGVSYYVDGVKRTWGLVKTSLSGGSSVTIGTNGGNYLIPAGTHTIAALADDLNLFSETNESNNQRSQTVTVGGSAVAPTPTPVTAQVSTPAKSDVVVTSLSYLNGSFSAVIKNQGSVATPATAYIGVAYYVDNIKRTWGLVNTSIAAGASITVNTNGGMFAISSGTHTIGALADDLNLISESNESNNRLDRSLTVGSGTTTTSTSSTPQTTTPPPPSSSTAQAILADMGASDAAAHGIESWPMSKTGKVGTNITPPSGYTSGTAWAVVYRDHTDSKDTNTRVAVTNFRGYLLDTSGHWTLVENASGRTIGGSRWPENFGGNPISDASRVEPDGSLSQYMLHGYTWHFFPTRMSYTPGTVVGFLSTYSARLVVDNPNLPDDRSSAKYLFASGGDWWRSLTAPFNGQGPNCSLWNNCEIGYSRLKYVTNNWQRIIYTNVPADLLTKYPPPL